MKRVIKLPDGTVKVSTINNEPSKAQNQFKDQTDVNKIVAKYKKTGEWLHLTKKQGVYADVSQITDYAESLQKVMNANAAFAALPSQIRLRFANDPSKLLEFLQDSKNTEEAISLGLVEKIEATSKNEPNDKSEASKSDAPKKS